jgi:hypothetical protein
MKITKHWVPASFFAVGLIVTGSFSPSAFGTPQEQQGYYREHPDLRQLVDQTQNDLRSARELEHEKGKEQDRYRHAQKSLSTFDRHLTKGKFDKDTLDQAIEDIQNILDHNTLQSSSRDALLSDVQNLRMARKAH